MGIVKIMGLLIFLYVTWRDLREDYKDDLLVSYSWLTVMLFISGGMLTAGLISGEPNWWLLWTVKGFNYYGAVLFVGLMTVIYCNRNGWKIWSFLESMTPGYCLLLAFMLAEDFVAKSFSIRVLMYFGIMVAGYLLANYLMNKYRSLVWYKSGKKGFVFLFVSLVVGVMLSIGNLVFKDSWWLLTINLIISLISIVELFILGEVFKS